MFTPIANDPSDVSSKARPVAIVTGGAGAGIGSGITEALARHDWRVLIVDADTEGIAELQRALAMKGLTVEGVAMDITSDGAAEEAVKEALKRYGRLDGLVNNAGVGLVKPAAEIEDKEFERILDVDFRAVFRFCRAALRIMMPAGGSIVNIGSIHAHRSNAGYSVYSAVKSGIDALTRGIALDYGGQNIRANCVHPGLVMSPQNDDLIKQFEPDVEGWLASFRTTKQLLPSLVTSRQVGDLISFLLGPEAGAITGQSITIDAGSSAMLFDRKAGQ